MKRHLLTASFIAALTLIPALAFAQTEGNHSSPSEFGGVRVFTPAPDADKWNLQDLNNGTRIFRCRPLVCADSAAVTFTFLKSPAEKPNPKTLERYAKVDFPKGLRTTMAAADMMSDHDVEVETIVARTGSVQGYPAVINESKLSTGRKSNYLETTFVFAGPVMIRIQSVSTNRELAQKSLNQFIEVLKIIEGPPPPEPSKPKASGTGNPSL